jgi:hypothetical protein
MSDEYFAAAAQARAARIESGVPTLRDQVQHLRDSAGVYLVGSSTLGCYKIGSNRSLRSGIGSCSDYEMKINTVMYRESDDGKQLSQQLHDLFRAHTCKIEDVRGEWFKLNDADLRMVTEKFGFKAVELISPQTVLAFECENFKPFDGGPVTCWDGTSGLVLVKKTGEIIYGRLKGEKKDLLARHEEGDVLLLAWHGQWRTDIFIVTPENFASPPDITLKQEAV